MVLGTSGALCQQQENRAGEPLPDAPSVRSAANERFRTAQEADGVVAHANLDTLFYDTLSYKEEPSRAESDFLGRHLYPALLKRNLNYHPSNSNSLMGRATYAASRVFITQDDSGRGRLNTSYFLGVLSAAIVHTAYRPYWNRPVSTPFSDFGSTIGNDAGMNLLHEFGPGLQQLVKSHAPKFVLSIENRVGRK